MFDENNDIIPEDINQEPAKETPISPQAEKSFFDFIKPQLTEQQLIKKDIRFTALGLAIPFLFILIIPYIWPKFYYFFMMKILSFSGQEAMELRLNPAVQQILQIIVSSFSFLVPFTIIAKCMRLKIDQTVQFGKPKKGTFVPFVFFGVGFSIFANIASSRVGSIFDLYDVEYSFSYGQSPKGLYGFALDFIATAIVPALVEEFACRGIVLGSLKKHGEGFAIIISSLLFGLMHGNFDQMPFAIVVGFALGYIYVKTESIWTCVLVHAINNAASVISNYLIGIVGVEIEVVLYTAYLIIGLLLAIVGVLLIANNRVEDYNLKPSEESVGTLQKCRWYCTSFATVMLIVFYFTEAMRYFPFFNDFINGLIG